MKKPINLAHLRWIPGIGLLVYLYIRREWPTYARRHLEKDVVVFFMFQFYSTGLMISLITGLFI